MVGPDIGASAVITPRMIELHHADLRGLAARRKDAVQTAAATSFKLSAWLKEHKAALACAASRTSSVLPSDGYKRPIVVHPEKLEAWLAAQALTRATRGHHSNKHKVIKP